MSFKLPGHSMWAGVQIIGSISNDSWGRNLD